MSGIRLFTGSPFEIFYFQGDRVLCPMLHVGSGEHEPVFHHVTALVTVLVTSGKKPQCGSFDECGGVGRMDVADNGIALAFKLVFDYVAPLFLQTLQFVTGQ